MIRESNNTHFRQGIYNGLLITALALAVLACLLAGVQ